MYTKQDLVNKLQEGADPADLANEFAAILNEAISENDKLNEQIEAENAKLDVADETAEAILDFLELYYPSLYDEEMRDKLTGEALIEAFDTLEKEITKVMDSLEALSNLFDTVSEKEKQANMGADDIFKAFFEMNNI